MDQKLIDRLWRDVERTETCWLWTGWTSKDGYGRLTYKTKEIYTHRLSWQIHNGEIPVGLLVLHECDTPACVRPDHLFLGTHGDNGRDRATKGRTRNQYGSPTCSPDEVHYIKQLYRAGGISQREIARRTGVHPVIINNIVHDRYN